MEQEKALECGLPGPHWHLRVSLFAGSLRSTYRLHESYMQVASKAILVDESSSRICYTMNTA
jgi:hypothetical protein